MSNVIQILGTDRALATGFFKSEEKSPVNEVWKLYLPIKDIDVRLTYMQINMIFDRAKVFSGVQFDFISVDDRDYTDEALYAIKQDLRRLPVSESCVINVPAKILWGK